ncbi:thioesterase domain-containing protein [Rhizobium leguminosarum]|uniref:thioesterase II family protein n=1 Tax=Rhizobium TaxID=379 RepID=UPI0013EED30D
MKQHSSKVGRVKRALCQYRPNRDARVRLFCFPHAGGGAAIFTELANILVANGFDVCCVELPGRDNRFSEPAIDNIREMAAFAAEVVSILDDLPYTILGYSMGASIERRSSY